MRTNPVTRRARDAGLRRVQSITRWTLAGALAGTGLFAGLAAKSASPVKVAGTKAPVTAAPSDVPAARTRSRGDDGGGDDGNPVSQSPVSQSPVSQNPVSQNPVSQNSPTVTPAFPGANLPLVSGAS